MFGYAGKILRVDLSSGSISELPTIDYADRFLGGRGIAEALYWDEVPPEANAFDAENALIFATGPLAGVPMFGGARWLVYSKSPATFPEHSCSCNLGGDWGLRLKSAGYDAVLPRPDATAEQASSNADATGFRRKAWVTLVAGAAAMQPEGLVDAEVVVEGAL